VTTVRETGKPIAEVARDLGMGAGTLGTWVKKDRLTRGGSPMGLGSTPAMCAGSSGRTLSCGWSAMSSLDEN
jgi:transposase-like protein